MAEPTVAAGFARAVLEFAVSRGASRKALAERSGIDAARPPEGGRVPFAKYVALMRAGKEMCADPAFALHLAESPYAETGIGCAIGSFAASADDGCALFNRYSRLNVEVECDGESGRYALTRGAGQLWVVDTRRNPNDFPELTEFSFTCTVRVARRLWGERQVFKAVHVTHAEPGHRAEYERIFQVPVIFGSDRNALLLADDAWLTRRNPVGSGFIFDILSTHVESRLKMLEHSKTVRGRVEGLLAPSLHTGEVSVDVIARKLGITRQTLFRRLKSEGTTFAQVLDELRHRTALHYLSEKNISVDEAAYLLGYSDRAAFSRAFKRWTGSSPRTARASKARVST